jgi:hypothetical protein
MIDRTQSSQPRPVDPAPRMSAARGRHPFLPHVIQHCRTCARLCALLAEDPVTAAEASEALGDCAITCGALMQLLASASAMDHRRALQTCATDCRWAAEACQLLGDTALARQCEQACRACAALCDHERDFSDSRG